jgi:hypothetical protein
MELYLKNWYDKFLNEIKRTKDLRIVSPFIKEQIIRNISNVFDLNRFELITRFKLADFASGVSSLSGLRYCVDKGSKIYGIKDLHSKIYIFDNRAAIITSANLTSGGLFNNHECGIYISDQNVVQNLLHHFNDLKIIGGAALTSPMCEEWESQISKVEVKNSDLLRLNDYGASMVNLNAEKNYFVKFFGTGGDRRLLDFNIREEVENALCHYACGFPTNKRPRQIKTGDIIYMARMTENPNDYAIFGKAEAIEHVDGRDEATEAEIAERDWKAYWPVYLRMVNPLFIDGTLGDCVLLSDLMKALSYESFPSTKSRYEDGEVDLSIKKVLARRAYVKLTHKAAEWLELRFQDSLTRTGQIDQQFIDSLPTSDFANLQSY